MITALCIALYPLLGSSAEMQAQLQGRLHGGSASIAEAQAALSHLLGWSSTTPSGITFSGREAAVEELPLDHLYTELEREIPVLAHVQVSGKGPERLRLAIPLSAPGAPVEVYLRLETGWWQRIEPPAARGLRHVILQVRPGRYVVRHVDKFSLRPDFSRLFGEEPLPSAAPEAKERWRFYRAGAQEVRGPLPLILIHGSGTDRWHDFIHWCRFSPQAEALREEYQLWNFVHERRGVNAAVGFDPDCPSFEESNVAYLDRFIRRATEEGVPEGDLLHFFPEGPFSMLTHSHGALKARAFLQNFPAYHDRLLALITLGAPHTGTPLGTVEWIQYTSGQFGLRAPSFLMRVFDAAIRAQYFSVVAQSDLDAGWGNFDAAGGQGIPYRRFSSWSHDFGWQERVLSPRDANQTGARQLPGYEDDTTFQPQEPLDTYCGGLDLIHPETRGDLFTDRMYLYASFIQPRQELLDALALSFVGEAPAGYRLYENAALRLVSKLLGAVETEGAEPPWGAYRLNDGFIPLQSQLFLDGHEDRLIYQTRGRDGWETPVIPYRLDWELVREHTLVDPARIRLFPGWSHLETVTGRYNRVTGQSPLFQRVAQDLLDSLN